MLDELSEQVGALLLARQLLLVTAESCTGGGVAAAITAVPGSSHWFDRGFVTYTNKSKEEMLGVAPATLKQQGAVSEATVREMVAGALARSDADVALAISGVAGPGGGSLDKPVGTVWIAWGEAGRTVRAKKFVFQGAREQVRQQAVTQALRGVVELLDGGA